MAKENDARAVSVWPMRFDVASESGLTIALDAVTVEGGGTPAGLRGVANGAAADGAGRGTGRNMPTLKELLLEEKDGQGCRLAVIPIRALLAYCAEQNRPAPGRLPA